MRTFFYLDGSAIVKHYALEKGTEVVDEIVRDLRVKRVIISIWGVAEAVAALNRKKNVEPAALKDFSALIFKLLQDTNDFWSLRADSEDVRSSFPLIIEHNLNSTDALHLYLAKKAKTLVEQIEGTAILVTADQRLLRAAKAEDLTVIDPEQISESELKKLL